MNVERHFKKKLKKNGIFNKSKKTTLRKNIKMINK